MDVKAPEFTPERQAKAATALELLRRIAADHAPATLANSFGAEDMVLMDMICRNRLAIEIFSLDTGRLHDETYDLMHRAREHYQADIQVFFPDTAAIQDFVRANGLNPFRPSGQSITRIDQLKKGDDRGAVKDALDPYIRMRKACCGIRKVEPLKRALSGKKAWVTGLRREQAVTRRDLPLQERDDDHGLEKFNPLAEWSEKDVWAYIHANRVPYNDLHDRGFPSIGCAPCTRAIAAGEDIRAGRWWWEDPDSKECGLHVHA
jgi:phosphoadenosine phosphosulfate reductase